jgi:transcriptional regulator with XRE-family HTH domain
VVRGRKNPLYFGLALRLRRARRNYDLSFERLAKAAGLASGITVFHVERTAGHVPRLDTVERIAYALHLSPAFLAYGIDGEANAPAKGLRCEGVAQRLADARAARGLSVLAVAKLAGLSHTAVGNVERGTMPTLATAEALAKALDLSPAWLAFGLGPQELQTRRKVRTAQPDARD